MPFAKCVSQPAVTPVPFTLVEMKEKYEAEKQKNKALEDFQIKHKQNMVRMTKIVGDYKSELDKARKELKDAKGKKWKSHWWKHGWLFCKRILLSVTAGSGG